MTLFGLPGGQAAWRPLEETYDPYTLRIVDAVIGVGPGWRCCEVGAGAGSIAGALHDRAGTVIALDGDARHLEHLRSPTFAIVEADIESTDLPNDLDLVHSRFLLDLVEQPEAVLEKFAAALRPGGWVFVEDWDESTLGVAIGDDEVRALHTRVVAARQEIWAAAGLDSFLGRNLPGWLHSLDLVDVDSECGCRVHRGGTPETTPWRDSLRRSRESLVEAGLTAAELDRDVTLLDAGAVTYFSPLVVRAWGRRAPSA